MSEHTKSLLGFAMRAGQVHVGASKAQELTERGKAALVLVDEMAAGNTLDRLTRKCSEARVPIRVLPTGVLGQSVGRPQTMALALPKGSFADNLLRTLPPTDTTDRHTGNI